MNMNQFKSYRDSVVLKGTLKCNHIEVGDHTYYSGYYHGKSFEDCVLYLDEQDNERDPSTLDRLVIGKFTCIASGAKFMMGGNMGHNYHHNTIGILNNFEHDYDGVFRTPQHHQQKGDTIIGNDVWIGYEATIMPGIQIEDGAVIAARSVVTKNVGAYEIWGGAPAVFIKKRFQPDRIKKLLEMQWWNWDKEIIKRNLPLLRSEKTEILYQKFRDNEL